MDLQKNIELSFLFGGDKEKKSNQSALFIIILFLLVSLYLILQYKNNDITEIFSDTFYAILFIYIIGLLSTFSVSYISNMY